MANVSITGNISEPKLEFVGPQSKARLTFSVAENHSRYDKDKNEWITTGTTWYRVTIWDEFAENVANVLAKGDRVIIEGRSYTRSYEKDSEERTSFELHVNNIGKAIPKRAPQAQQATGYAPQTSSQPDPWNGSGGGWDVGHHDRPAF